MTYQTFLEKLAMSGHGWILMEDGRIRNEFCECPWVALHINKSTMFDVIRNGIEISSQIFSAADNDKYCNPAIRADLLKACKLTKEEKPHERPRT